MFSSSVMFRDCDVCSFALVAISEAQERVRLVPESLAAAAIVVAQRVARRQVAVRLTSDQRSGECMCHISESVKVMVILVIQWMIQWFLLVWICVMNCNNFWRQSVAIFTNRLAKMRNEIEKLVPDHSEARRSVSKFSKTFCGVNAALTIRVERCSDPTTTVWRATQQGRKSAELHVPL